MAYSEKLIFSLIICTMISLVSGCQKIYTEQSGDTSRENIPVLVVLDSMRDTLQDSVTDLSISQHVNGGEFPDKAEIVVEESGLQDDSIVAEKTVFTVHYRENKWQIIKRTKMQQCRDGRGHSDFSEQPCQ